MFLETINGTRAGLHPAARWFVAEGFAVGADGLQYRAPRVTALPADTNILHGHDRGY